MVAEVPKELLKRLYVSESFEKDPENRAFLEKFSAWETVTDPVFGAMSDTQTPQGVLAVSRKLSYTLDDLFRDDRPAHLMILENLQDPGNLGTILRAGEGAGITGVIMSRDTVDLYNPKVIRSTMGSVFRVPFLYTDDLGGQIAALKERGVRLFAAHLGGRNNYDREDYTGNTGFLIGNEGNGLTEEISRQADTWVKIPMEGKVESLNAAIAASILMFETARQRRELKPHA
jgi:TrmH family RNA methyltransferase